MKMKYIFLASFLMLAVCFVGASLDADDSDAADTVTINVVSSGHGTVTGGGTYSLGDTVTMRATPSSGYRFVNWTFDGGTQTANPYSYTITSVMLGHNVTYTANFEPSSSPTTYTVSFAPSPTGYGTVSRNAIVSIPSGSAISVSGNTVTINGITVTATAADPSGEYVYTFTGWSNTSGTVTANRTISANFTKSVGSTVVTVNSSGNGTATGGGTYYLGDTVTLTATPADGYVFTNWTSSGPGGSGTHSGNPLCYEVTTMMLGTNVTYTANFTEAPGATVIVDSSGNGTASGGGTFYLNDTVTLTATPDEGYMFVSWTSSGPGGSATHSANPLIYSITEFMLGTTVTFTVNFEEIAYAMVIVDSSGNGTATGGGSFYLYDTVTLTATPDDGYKFVSWTSSGPGGSGTHMANPLTYDITEFMLNTTVTYTANFALDDGKTYWTNDNFNGRVDVLFKFAADSKMHTMTMDLYTPTTADHATTWTDTGKDLFVEMDPATHRITVSVTGAESRTYNIGNWNTYIISIDTEHGKVTVVPVKVFASFTDYTVNDRQMHTILDFSDVIEDAAVLHIRHNDVGNQANRARFSVVDTWPFLDSYGVLLSNPTINMFDYFPQFDSIRVNFYSFAIFGDSITVNGITYPVTDGKVTVTYVTDDGKNFLPEVMPNQDPKNRTFDLTNIYVTFSDDGHAYLTFADKRFTIDLGQYQPGDWTISMAGTWYFTTMAYEPYTGYEKSLSGWKTLPTTSSNEMILIFLGVLAVAFAAVAIHVKRSGFGIVDLIIIGSAALVAFLLLG